MKKSRRNDRKLFPRASDQTPVTGKSAQPPGHAEPEKPAIVAASPRRGRRGKPLFRADSPTEE